MKAFFSELYERVFKNLGPTLIGLALAIGIQVLDFTTGWVTANLGSQWYGAAISLVLAAIGAWLKSKKSPEAGQL